MDWHVVVEIVQTAAVVLGIVFGIDQLRMIRRQRDAKAGIELMRPLQTPEMAEAIMQIYRLPDGLDEAGLRKALGDQFGHTLALLAMFESLGPLVARGHLPLDMYAQSYRGPTVFAWRRFRRYIEAERERGWPMLFEWLQWLAERLEERAVGSPDTPAYQRGADAL